MLSRAPDTFQPFFLAYAFPGKPLGCLQYWKSKTRTRFLFISIGLPINLPVRKRDRAPSGFRIFPGVIPLLLHFLGISRLSWKVIRGWTGVTAHLGTRHGHLATVSPSNSVSPSSLTSQTTLWDQQRQGLSVYRSFV